MKTLHREHRRYLAQILWAVRKGSRAQEPMRIPAKIALAAQKHGVILRRIK